MMVNPQEIVIDMPCDPANVEAKKASIRQVGIIQPITIWIEGLRVIDGFHRVKAAQDLGMPEVPATMIDCSEEAFWDARIQSARQHHEIEDARLAQWVYECWCASDPETKYTIDDFYRIVYDFELDEAEQGDNGSEIDAWFSDKARRWGLSSLGELGKSILTAAGVKTKWRKSGGGLPFDDARKVSNAFPSAGTMTPSIAEARKWVQSGAPVNNKGRGHDWIAKKRRDKNSDLYSKDGGSKEANRAYHLKQATNSMSWAVERMGMFAGWKYPFTLPELVAESNQAKSLTSLLADACGDFLKMMGKPLTQQGLIEENARLRKEVKALAVQLEQTQARLTRAIEKNAEPARVLSSTDIRHMKGA